ncbi:hypothetical protein D3C83_312660 [compost metagenome]
MLVTRDLADGMDCVAANLARAFGDVVSHLKDLIGLFVQQQVVVAKMRPAQVPMKVFGLEIKREDVS